MRLHADPEHGDGRRDKHPADRCVMARFSTFNDTSQLNNGQSCVCSNTGCGPVSHTGTVPGAFLLCPPPMQRGNTHSSVRNGCKNVILLQFCRPFAPQSEAYFRFRPRRRSQRCLRDDDVQRVRSLARSGSVCVPLGPAKTNSG